MAFVRVSLLVILWGVAPQAALADPYVFYQPTNGTSVLSAEHYESGFTACYGAIGAPWSNNRSVVGASWDTTAGTCTAYLDNNFIGPMPIVSGNSSCPGDELFDFANQVCEIKPVDQQLHATVLAAFLWMCLIGGMSIGFKAGS